MRYEIINPSDKCYIYAEDVRIARIVCVLLGNGMYGLVDEQGNVVMHVFEELDIPQEKISDFVNQYAAEIASVLESFEYEGERTSLNNIGRRASVLADAFRKVRPNAEQSN